MSDAYELADWERYHGAIFECMEWMERLQAWVACNLVTRSMVSSASVLETWGPGFFLCTPHELARDPGVLRSITEEVAALEPSEPCLPGFAPGLDSWHELLLGYHRRMVLHWFQHVYTPLLERRDAARASGDQVESGVLRPLLIPEPADQDSIAPFLENRYFRGVRTHLERESKLMAERCDGAVEDEEERSTLWISVSEAAPSAHRTPSTIRRWRKEGRLRTNKHGRIDADDLQRKLNEGALGG